MAFAGTLVSLAVGTGGDNIIELTGLTLAATAGAFNIANADSGRLTTDQTPPANNTAISGTWGPGAGAWTQVDVDRVSVLIQRDTALATALPVLVAKALVGGPPGDCAIDVHNLGAGAVAGTTIRLKYEHSATL